MSLNSIGYSIALFACLVLGAQGAPPPGLEPRTITLAAGQRSVADILLEIEKQTGNRAVDRRTPGPKAKVDITFDGQTYWQALDRLAEKLDARLSFYGEDSIALVDGPRRIGAVVDAGLCRIEFKNLAVQRDLETDRRTCVAQVEIAWEPRFEPLYLTVDRVKGSFAADARGKAMSFEPMRGVAQPVAQRRAQTVELRFPGPDRSSSSIATLDGELKFLGPTRMLTATFPKMNVGSEKQSVTEDGVKIALNRVAENKQNWTFDLEIENPEGTPEFESFQTWIDNNRIHLERTVGGKKEIWTPRPDDWTADLAGRKAKITYVFAGVQGKGPMGGWTLAYRTPGRIVEFSVPFEFRNVALP